MKHKNNLSFGTILLFLSAFVSVQSSAQILSLEQYLNEVRIKHEGIRALVETSEAAKLREGEGSILTFPSVFANLQVANDKKPTANPAFAGNETAFQGYSLGVIEQTGFGLSAKLSYTLNYIKLSGTNPAFVPIPTFYEAKPVLELTQSLLKNGFGRETRATVHLLESQARATHLSDSFKIKMILAEAEMTYWGLVVAREMVTVYTDSLERAKKIREWSLKRARMELADRSDFLQAEAGLQTRMLEYQMAVDEEGSVQRIFNKLRGSDTSTVEETLMPLDKEALEKTVVLEKKGVRADVKAAEEMEKVAKASAELGREKNLPSLDLFGTFALNGRNQVLSNSTSDSLKTQFPTVGVGIKFSSSLDFGVLSNDRAAYLRESKASELNYRRKVFEESQEWKDLTTKFGESKRKLKLTLAIEAAQNKKLLHEKERLKKGRSVTYQVLLFEQDYASAQAVRIKTQAEILRFIAQMKTFGEEK